MDATKQNHSKKTRRNKRAENNDLTNTTTIPTIHHTRRQACRIYNCIAPLYDGGTVVGVDGCGHRPASASQPPSPSHKTRMITSIAKKASDSNKTAETGVCAHGACSLRDLHTVENTTVLTSCPSSFSGVECVH